MLTVRHGELDYDLLCVLGWIEDRAGDEVGEFGHLPVGEKLKRLRADAARRIADEELGEDIARWADATDHLIRRRAGLVHSLIAPLGDYEAGFGRFRTPRKGAPLESLVVVSTADLEQLIADFEHALHDLDLLSRRIPLGAGGAN